jgi:hypothetical protein
MVSDIVFGKVWLQIPPLVQLTTLLYETRVDLSDFIEWANPQTSSQRKKRSVTSKIGQSHPMLV